MPSGFLHIDGVYIYYKKWNNTPAVRSKISSKLIFASCVWYSDLAYYELCVLIKDIGRRLPLQLQCSYQGQQDDFSQSARGNYKTRFWGGQNLTAVKGKGGLVLIKSERVWRVSRMANLNQPKWRTYPQLPAKLPRKSPRGKKCGKAPALVREGPTSSRRWGCSRRPAVSALPSPIIRLTGFTW